MGKEDIAEITGSFGCWQKWIFAFIFYISVIGIWQNLSITFLAPNVPFHCVNSTGQCWKVEENISLPCKEWEYDRSFYPETIVSEWDLVCGREWLVSLAKSIFMIGYLFSVIIFGQLSDWIGRYPVIVICYVITVISMFLSLLSTSYLMFIILRFLQAFGRTGLTTTGYVLLMEIVGEEHRTMIGIGAQLAFSLGFSCLAGLAYVFKHWFWLQLAMSIPFLPFAFAFWVIPESPRWLLMQKDMQKLEKLLKKATKINRKEFKLTRLDLELLGKTQTKESHKSVLDLYRTPKLRARTLSMIYIWMVNAFIFYGISYNTNDLAGDPYINFLISGVIEFPSYAFLYWVLNRVGRRPSLVYLMVIGGVACAAKALNPPSMPWLSTSLAMAGKFCITASFGLLYLYASEIFPTVVRNVAIGSSSMWARIGSILAPFVKELGKATYPWLPDVVYGLLAISSGLLALSLPESRGRPIPDTLEEGEQYTDDKIKGSSSKPN